MSHCDNCNEIDRLDRQREAAYKLRCDGQDMKNRCEEWGSGKGLLRFLIPWKLRATMWVGACKVIRDAEKEMEELEAAIETAEKRTVEGQCRVAARKMAAAVEKDLYGIHEADPLANVKGLAEVLDADLKFEDKVADLKLDDIVKEVASPKKCDCGSFATDLHTERCALNPENYSFERKQDHSVHQGTHYVGDACKPAHGNTEAPMAGLPGVPHHDLVALYSELPTPELKTHVEAALDAAVARGVMSLRRKKKSTQTKR